MFGLKGACSVSPCDVGTLRRALVASHIRRLVTPGIISDTAVPSVVEFKALVELRRKPRWYACPIRTTAGKQARREQPQIHEAIATSRVEHIKGWVLRSNPRLKLVPKALLVHAPPLLPADKCE